MTTVVMLLPAATLQYAGTPHANIVGGGSALSVADDDASYLEYSGTEVLGGVTATFDSPVPVRPGTYVTSMGLRIRGYGRLGDVVLSSSLPGLFAGGVLFDLPVDFQSADAYVTLDLVDDRYIYNWLNIALGVAQGGLQLHISPAVDGGGVQEPARVTYAAMLLSIVGPNLTGSLRGTRGRFVRHHA